MIHICWSILLVTKFSIRTGQLPKDWNVSHVVAIPNAAWGTVSLRLTAHIPIVCIPSKVLERHFYMLLSDHLAEHHPLSNCQWGFHQRSLLCPHWSARPVTGYNNLKQGMRLVQYSLTSKNLLIKYLTNFYCQNSWAWGWTMHYMYHDLAGYITI